MRRAGNARFTAETTQEKSLPLSQKLQRKGWITYDNLYVRVQKNLARRDVSKTAIKGAKTIHFSLCIVDFGLQRTRKERFGQKRLHNLAIIVNQWSKQSGYLLKNVSIFAFFDPFRYICRIHVFHQSGKPLLTAVCSAAQTSRKALRLCVKIAEMRHFHA